jgi:acyl-homoserine lactone acylase PvdQ
MRTSWKIRGLALAVLLALPLILLPHPALHAPDGVQTVRIVRDVFGVPHIYGATDEAVLFGFGYAQAEDHLLEMLQNYLAAEGRRAEFFGRGYLKGDIAVRAVLSYSDEELLAAVEPETVKLVEAFTRGVNRYISEHHAELPNWAQDFVVTAAQVLRFAHYTMISRSLSVAFKELRGEGSAFADPGLEEASNQWVVGASRTAAGAPIFLMDPHLPWSGMNRWYEAHLVGDYLNVYGATFYGLPFIVMGHNGKVVWSMTRNGPDLADVFVEELHLNDPTRYLTESGWARMSVRKEVFRVRGEGPVTEKIYYTRNGWVVQTDLGRHRAFALALEGLELWDSPSQFLAMNRAQSIAEFKEALALHQLLLWNVMAADSQGNLFYVYNAHLHRRSDRWAREEPRPGWDPAARWSPEIIPFQELPQVENPESDWMQNNNVMPWFVTSGVDLKPEDFPTYLVQRGAGLNDRGQRATEVLSQARGWTMTDALALAADTLVVAAEETLPSLFTAYEAAPPGKKQSLTPAIEILRSWNRRADVDQPGMTLFHFWWRRPEREQDPLLALEAAISEMEELYGTIEVPWGEVHRIRRGRFDLPIAGSKNPSTLWMAHGPMDERGTIYTDAGSSFTMVVELGPRIEAYSLLPYGESADPASPHYADQVPLKSRGEPKRAWFYRDEVLAHVERAYTLEFRPDIAVKVRRKGGPK